MLSKVKSKSVASIILLVSAVILDGCGYLVDQRSSLAPGKNEELTPIQKAQLSFRDVYQGVIEPKCVKCHGTSGGVNLQNYENVLLNIRAVESSTLVRKTMPKNDSLSSYQLQILAAWIDNGGPLNGIGDGKDPTPSPPPKPRALEPTFNSIKASILAVRCLTCHSNNGEAKHIPLATREDLVDSPRELVLPNNPDESGLILSIERSDRKRMPPPETGAGLSETEISTIRKWIEEGAQN